MKKRVLSEEIKLKVKAVIFDMDGVITNTMPDHFRAWCNVLAQEGISVSYYDIYSREGQRGIDSVKEIFQKYRKPFAFKKGKMILKRKEEYFKRIVKTRFIPGSRSFLKRLSQENFKLALVTGTARHELKRILPAYLLKVFSVVITGSDVQNGKPHPEPYLKALKQLNLKAREAAAIENAPFGIQSAKKAGLKCLALETSLAKKYLSEADYIFHSFKQFRKQVQFSYDA